ncbi:MAG: septum formation protein Maf [Pirellulales bacterium]|nr:septum formation protein Maf [Pirellulales bacterium]
MQPPFPRTLILASRSPRRRELLAAAGYEFEVVPADESVECNGACSRESPAELVARLAYAKAADVAQRVGRSMIVACDTVAECDGQILGKPPDVNLARRMLEMLRGREHRVLTGLCVWDYPDRPPETRVAVTRLRMDFLSDAQIDEYLESYLWEGKSGAFGYQDRHGWLQIVEGSESNVVGLPMELLGKMLGE